MLEIKNLSLVKQKKILLRNISLTASKGKITLLLGKSGSGKTTLLRCVAQLEKEYRGAIAYSGRNLSETTPKERSRILGFVSQNYALFPHLSALDNCAQPLSLSSDKQSAYKEAKTMLARLSMDRYFSSFPHQLSGGQQQRVALARALLLNPAFILLDEPTSSLDPENTQILLNLIQQFKGEGKGFIISSQDMPFAEKLLERAFFLENGSLVETYESANSPAPESKLREFMHH